MHPNTPDKDACKHSHVTYIICVLFYIYIYVYINSFMAAPNSATKSIRQIEDCNQQAKTGITPAPWGGVPISIERQNKATRGRNQDFGRYSKARQRTAPFARVLSVRETPLLPSPFFFVQKPVLCGKFKLGARIPRNCRDPKSCHPRLSDCQHVYMCIYANSHQPHPPFHTRGSRDWGAGGD